MKNANISKNPLKKVFNALLYSIEGIKVAWKEESAFRQIIVLAIIFIPLGFWLGNTWESKILLILPCFISIIAELVNSAIENAVDYTGTNIHPLAKKAKDMGSAIQLVSLLLWATIWISYLWYRFL